MASYNYDKAKSKLEKAADKAKRRIKRERLSSEEEQKQLAQIDAGLSKANLFLRFSRGC